MHVCVVLEAENLQLRTTATLPEQSFAAALPSLFVGCPRQGSTALFHVVLALDGRCLRWLRCIISWPASGGPVTRSVRLEWISTRPRASRYVLGFEFPASNASIPYLSCKLLLDYRR